MLPGMVASYLMFNKSIMVQAFKKRKALYMKLWYHAWDVEGDGQVTELIIIMRKFSELRTSTVLTADRELEMETGHLGWQWQPWWPTLAIVAVDGGPVSTSHTKY